MLLVLLCACSCDAMVSGWLRVSDMPGPTKADCRVG